MSNVSPGQQQDDILKLTGDIVAAFVVVEARPVP